MNAAEVASRLAGPRPVGGGSRTAPARHQSLAAAVDWSYRLLSARERSLFCRLSVLAGGFDLQAAHGACGEPADTEDDTLELLAGLVDKSMVTVGHTTDTTTYRVLETMRQYGRERLAASGELDAVRERHARHVLDLVERGAPGLLGPDEGAWVDRLLRAYDDLRLAVGWATAREDADLALRLVAGLADLAYWRVGYEMLEWSEAALRVPGAVDHPLAPAVYGGASRGAWCLGDFPRAVRLATATAMPEWVEGPSRSVQPAEVLAVIDLYEGRGDAALAGFERQVDLARASGDPLRLAWALSQMALCHAYRGEPRLARRAGAESLALARAAGGNPSAVAIGMMCVGRGLQDEDPATALTCLDASVELFASVRNRWFMAFAGMYAAATHVAISDPATATGALLPVLDEWEQLGDGSQQWLCLLFATQLLIRIDAEAEAVTLHHALVAAARPAPFDADRLAALAGSLGPARFETAARAGSTMDGSAAVALVRSRLRGVRPAA